MMKTYIKIASLVMILTLGACSTNFLEIPSQTSLSTAVFFKSQADFEQAINGAYAPLRQVYGGLYGAYVMGETRSDNTTYKYNTINRGASNPERIADFMEDEPNYPVSNKYVRDFAVIARANQVLGPIDGVDFDKTSKDNIKGQAFFLRALCYFDLVQYFGKIPLHLKPVTTIGETALPLSSVEDIYAQIIADTKDALALLPDKGTQVPGRITSGSAKTLLGNVYIVLKRWADAEVVLKDVTGYSLMANYASVFDPASKNNIESIFEIQYKEGTEGLNSSFFYTFLPQPITGNEVSVVTGIPEVSRNDEGFNIPTPDLIASYEPNDKRKEASIGMIEVSGVSYPYIKKYAHAHSVTGNTNDNFPVYRYAEVLLLIAEALNEQGKTSEALTYLNQVRLRAGLSNSPALGQNAVKDAIMNERRVELAFENKRWLDLVRTGTAETVMKAFGAKVKLNPQNYYFPAGIMPAPNAYTNIRLLFSIPASEATLNPYF